MGTIIAIQVAVSYPTIVEGLILFSPLGTEEVCSPVTDLAPICIFPIAYAAPFAHFAA
jgi:pimeloyl-ACP methyl ester carboxylesterase